MDVRDKIYIGGAWVASTGTGTLEVIDSTTEEVMATIPEGTAEDVDKAVQAAAAAFPAWSATSSNAAATASMSGRWRRHSESTPRWPSVWSRPAGVAPATLCPRKFL